MNVTCGWPATGIGTVTVGFGVAGITCSGRDVMVLGCPHIMTGAMAAGFTFQAIGANPQKSHETRRDELIAG